MKLLCVIFLLAGCLAQVPGPGGFAGPGQCANGQCGPCPNGNCGPCPNGNCGPCPNGQCGPCPNGQCGSSTDTPTGNAEGTDPSAGGEGGTPSPTEVNIDPTGPPNNVNRPCRRYDLQCVRYFFKDHSHCKKPLGKVPEPYLHPLSNQFYAAFNVTVTNVNAYYTGFNSGRVRDLYVNRQTDKVVITIEFTDLRKASKDVFFRYHRRAREPIITYGYSFLEYPSLILTVTIPQVNDLRFDKSDSFAYSNTLPRLEIDPRLGESSDPIVPSTFAYIKANLPTLATENLLTQSSFYATVYIQKVICDFGLKIALA